MTITKSLTSRDAISFRIFFLIINIVCCLLHNKNGANFWTKAKVMFLRSQQILYLQSLKNMFLAILWQLTRNKNKSFFFFSFFHFSLRISQKSRWHLTFPLGRHRPADWYLQNKTPNHPCQKSNFCVDMDDWSKNESNI